MWIGRLWGWRNKATWISDTRSSNLCKVSEKLFYVKTIGILVKFLHTDHGSFQEVQCRSTWRVEYVLPSPRGMWLLSLSDLLGLGFSLVAWCALFHLLIGGLIWELCCFSPPSSLPCITDCCSAWCWCLRNWGFSSLPSPEPLGCPWLFSALSSCVSFSGEFALWQKACTSEWDWQSKITFNWWYLQSKLYGLCVL